MIACSNSNSQVITIFCLSVSFASSPIRATKGSDRCPWVALQEGNPEFKEPKSFILVSKHTCPLLQSETHLSKAIPCMNIIAEII